MYQIHVEQLSVAMYVGCYEFEKHSKQTVLIDLALTIDPSLAASTDELSNSIDYALVCQQIASICEAKHYQLLETLLQELVNFFNDTYPNALNHLKVHKPNAIKNAKSVTVSYTV